MSSPKTLPYGYKIRDLSYDDYTRGYLNLLSQLSVVGNISEADFKLQVDMIKKNPNHHVVVIENPSKIVIGSCTLLMEPKFIHTCSLVGHIEDVVIDKNYRKYGLGSILLLHIIELAKSYGCYKIILSCKANCVPFYEKNGFYPHETSMRLDIQTTARN